MLYVLTYKDQFCRTLELGLKELRFASDSLVVDKFLCFLLRLRDNDELTGSVIKH